MNRLADNGKVHEWTDADVAAALPAPASEGRGTTQQVRELLNRIRSRVFKKEKTLQARWQKALNEYGWAHVVPTDSVKYLHGAVVNASNDASNKAPDLSRMPSDTAATVDNVELIKTAGAVMVVTALELKATDVSLDDLDSRGQVANYGARILVSQPWRLFVVVGLYNGHKLWLARCTPDESDGCVLQQSRLFDVHEDFELCVRFVHALLHGPPEALGWVRPTLEGVGPLRIVRRLGKGATSAVYEAVASAGVHYAVKVMGRRQDLERTLLASEKATLEGLHRLLAISQPGVRALVPVPVALLADDRVLVMTPVGRPLAGGRLTAAMVASLVELLRIVHANYVHRDLRLSNLLQTEDGRLLVIDWGYAAPVARAAAPAGAVWHSPAHILQAAIDRRMYVTAAADDLRTLLRVCYLDRRGVSAPKGEYDVVRDFWVGAIARPEWTAWGGAAAEEAALRTVDGRPDYDGFREHLQRLVQD